MMLLTRPPVTTGMIALTFVWGGATEEFAARLAGYGPAAASVEEETEISVQR